MRAIRYCWVFVLALISATAAAQSIPPTNQSSPALQVLEIEGTIGGVVNPKSEPRSTPYAYPSEWLSFVSQATGKPGHDCGGGANPYQYTWTWCRVVNTNGSYSTHNIRARAYCQGETPTEYKSWPSNGSTPNCLPKPTCPAGYTLNAVTGMCDPEATCPMYGTPEGAQAPVEQPAGCQCPADHDWVPMNGCRKKCGHSDYVGNVVGGSDTWPGDNFTFPAGGHELCYNGCIIQSKAGETYHYDDGSFKSKATWTNWACQTSSEPPKPPADDPPVNPKEPPCDATEGVLTSSSGKVACVPYGTPSPRKPDVKVREKKETFPDNSTKTTTETKTTDPKTNASHTHTTTTSSGGMAGPAGTTEGKESETGDGNGGDGDGDCEGDDCGEGDGPEFTPPEGGDLYEKGDRTFKQAWEEFVGRITGAQLPASMSNFFNVGGVPSSCGGMSINVPMLDIMISLDEYICGETGQFLMYVARIVIAAMAAWLAFRIAFQ